MNDEYFEDVAAVFYEETGELAPGKTQSGPRNAELLLKKLWEMWLEKKALTGFAGIVLLECRELTQVAMSVNYIPNFEGHEIVGTGLMDIAKVTIPSLVANGMAALAASAEVDRRNHDG